MQAYLRVVAPCLLGFLHVAVDDAGILAMDHQGKLTGLENTFQRLLAVDQHITR